MKKAFMFSLLLFLIGICYAQKNDTVIDTIPVVQKKEPILSLKKDSSILSIAKSFAENKKTVDSTEKDLITANKNLEDATKKQRGIEDEIANLKRLNKKITSDINNKKAQFDKQLFEANTAKMKYEEILKNSKNQLESDSLNLIKIQETLKNTIDSLETKKDNLHEVEKKVDSSTNVLNNIKSQLTKLENSDSLDLIAIIKIKDPQGKVPISRNGKSGDTAIIISVHIVINEGVISDILVETDKGNFRNKRAPIDLVHFNETRKKDNLFLEGTDSNTVFINVGDVIKYTTKHTYRDIPYLFTETNLTLKEPVLFLQERTSINSYFEAGTFTDLQGINGKANTLVEANASLKFILRTNNLKYRPIIFFNYIKVVGAISKFDNKYKGTPYSVADSVARIDLLQRTKDRLGVKLNIVHFLPSPYPSRLIDDIELNVGYFYNGSNLLTTAYKDAAQTVLDTTFTRIVQNQFVFEPTVNISRNSAIGAIISLPFYVQNIKANANIANKEWRWYFAPSITLYYSSKKTPGNKLFFKYVNYTDLKETKYGFSQAQIGYSANFTEIFKLK